MLKNVYGLALVIGTFAYAGALAQTPTPAPQAPARGGMKVGQTGNPDPGVNFVVVVDNPHVRVLQVTLQPGAVRRPHVHNDVTFHMLVPVTGSLDLTVEKEPVVTTVNMASIYVARPFSELTVEEYDENVAVDMRSAFICARAAWPHMRRTGGGHIINFSDWLSRSGRPRYPGYLPYYVAKAGVIGLTEALALELAPDRILVNAIAPGPILAPPETTDEELASVEKATPLGSWGGEKAISDAVIALLQCDFITGETIRVDGGRHVK